MTNSINISAVIITFNEEKNIERCIESLSGIADEILIVDSFSTDNTTALAHKLGARVVEKTWQGYTEQKNFANSQAKFDWILSIDADEAISETLKKSILQIKANCPADAFVLNRLTNYCGHWVKYGDWYPDQKLRLWCKNKGQWQGMIHEQVTMMAAARIDKLKGNILHYSYYSIMDHVAQMNKFTEIMAKDNVFRNKKATVLKIMFSPPFKFIKSYWLRLGILDGYYGFVIATMSAHATLLKYLRTRELQQKKITHNFSITIMQKLFIYIATIQGALAVMIGAFGAHAFKNHLTAIGRIDVFETAVKYQFYHTFALLAIGILQALRYHKFFRLQRLCFSSGIHHFFRLLVPTLHH